MFSVAPIWDGNETWLILGGGGLFAVFHLAYAILMPALYVPILAHAHRADLPRHRLRVPLQGGTLEASSGTTPSTTARSWRPSRRASCSAPSCRALPMTDASSPAEPWDFLTPFSVLTGVSLVFGYGLLGATWCVMKTTGELEIWARRMAIALPHRHDRRHGDRLASGCRSSAADIEARWFSLAEHRSSSRRSRWSRPLRPIRLYRDLDTGAMSAVPSRDRAVPARLSRPRHQPLPLHRAAVLTIWQAANTVNSQLFALVGFAIVLPITFAYTAYAYWVFRGKVPEDIEGGGYH